MATLSAGGAVFFPVRPPNENAAARLSGERRRMGEALTPASIVASFPGDGDHEHDGAGEQDGVEESG